MVIGKDFWGIVAGHRTCVPMFAYSKDFENNRAVPGPVFWPGREPRSRLTHQKPLQQLGAYGLLNNLIFSSVVLYGGQFLSRLLCSVACRWVKPAD